MKINKKIYDEKKTVNWIPKKHTTQQKKQKINIVQPHNIPILQSHCVTTAPYLMQMNSATQIHRKRAIFKIECVKFVVYLCAYTS